MSGTFTEMPSWTFMHPGSGKISIKLGGVNLASPARLDFNENVMHSNKNRYKVYSVGNADGFSTDC